MNGLAPDTVQHLAENTLMQLPVSGEVIFRCGQQQSASLTKDWLTAVNQRLPYLARMGKTIGASRVYSRRQWRFLQFHLPSFTRRIQK